MVSRCCALRTGDTIRMPGDTARRKGGDVPQPQSDATFVACEKIKSVDLIATQSAPQAQRGQARSVANLAADAKTRRRRI